MLITTVTLNPALDEAVALDELQLGGKNRCALDSLDPGGKGLNASRVLHRLGRQTIALGYAGGLTGDLLRQRLREEGVPHEFFHVPESTRVNIMIYERADSRRTRLYLPGARVDSAMIESLHTRLNGVAQGSIVVLAGSVPPGLPLTIYRDLIRSLSVRGVRCIVDTSGEALGAALEARPYLVKPNVEEASGLLARPLLSDQAVLHAAQEFRTLGAAQVVISQGADGAIAVNGEGAWKGTAPAIARQSTVGSGDSMVAGLAMALDDGLPLCDALRLGCAAGAATAMVSGTRLCRAADVYANLPRIEIRALSTAEEVTR